MHLNVAAFAVDPILTERQVIDWIGVSSPTASRWRAMGAGPAFIQLGPRRIGYRKSAVEEWLAARERKTKLDRPLEAALEPSTE
jgi:predicted DNA-binding transcriptional regulator AlpA